MPCWALLLAAWYYGAEFMVWYVIGSGGLADIEFLATPSIHELQTMSSVKVRCAVAVYKGPASSLICPN